MLDYPGGYNDIKRIIAVIKGRQEVREERACYAAGFEARECK
jgi:hypothetical protein